MKRRSLIVMFCGFCVAMLGLLTVESAMAKGQGKGKGKVKVTKMKAQDWSLTGRFEKIGKTYQFYPDAKQTCGYTVWPCSFNNQEFQKFLAEKVEKGAKLPGAKLAALEGKTVRIKFVGAPETKGEKTIRFKVGTAPITKWLDITVLL